MITRKRRTSIIIFLNSKQIEEVSKFKYLGIIIDNKFTFRDHIQDTAEKCTKLINALSKSSKLEWGLKYGALRTIYTGAILPLLSYAAPVWSKAMTKKFNQKRITRVQRLMNIRISKAFRTTSNEALCVLTGLAPITIELQEIVKKYDLARNGDMNMETSLELNKWPHPADIPRIEGVHPKEAYVLNIYTDGSKSEDGVGSGVAIFQNNELTHQLKFRLDTNCSNNQAEQFAILKALQHVQHHHKDITPKSVAVFSDSRITLDSLKNKNNHSKLIEHIRHILKLLNDDNWTIAFTWIKAHAGITGNEIADQLAKQAAKGNSQPLYNKIPKSALLTTLKQGSLEKWQEEWQNTQNGSETKQYFPIITERLKIQINLTSELTTMLTGHGKLRAYYHRFNIIDDPTCICGGGSQTAHHLLYDCQLYSKERMQLRDIITKNGDRWPLNKSQIIRKYQTKFRTFISAIDFKSNQPIVIS